jgi:hypothetical protein
MVARRVDRQVPFRSDQECDMNFRHKLDRELLVPGAPWSPWPCLLRNYLVSLLQAVWHR